ncbi:hypothetical protein [Alkalibacterium thalassium]|uniref:hypothetical protein n=1 Tax=Alkalibacterium thalassium TaxID=426701 RepID=UPI001C40A683|nr:hypothetical protein [Alkalibacterium thalassium]
MTKKEWEAVNQGFGSSGSFQIVSGKREFLKQYCTLHEFSAIKNHLLSEQQVAKKEW